MTATFPTLHAPQSKLLRISRTNTGLNTEESNKCLNMISTNPIKISYGNYNNAMAPMKSSDNYGTT
jgi:hypothetical protein